MLMLLLSCQALVLGPYRRFQLEEREEEERI